MKKTTIFTMFILTIFTFSFSESLYPCVVQKCGIAQNSSGKYLWAELKRSDGTVREFVAFEGETDMEIIKAYYATFITAKINDLDNVQVDYYIEPVTLSHKITMVRLMD